MMVDVRHRASRSLSADISKMVTDPALVPGSFYKLQINQRSVFALGDCLARKASPAVRD
jgi:hypothetical protein